METFVKEFFTALHQTHLKALGYSKERFTFSRDAGEYIERVQFQGSQWNPAGESWQFYVNIGVQFKHLPPRTPDRDFPRTHAWSRIEAVVRDAPGQFRLSPETASALVPELSALLAKASAAIPKIASDVRAKCAGGKCAQLRAI